MSDDHTPKAEPETDEEIRDLYDDMLDNLPWFYEGEPTEH